MLASVGRRFSVAEVPMAASSPPERALLLALLGLTGVTGLVDAASYLGLGHVFTANMTGNVVFLGFALAGAPGLSVPRCSTALGGFFVGALLGGGLGARMSAGSRHRWATTAFAAEAVLLLAAAGASIGYPAAQPDDSAQRYAVIILTALAMGVRNATVRGLGVPDLTTTVLTLTITGLAADSALAGGSNPRWPRRIASVLTMAAGAAAGVLLLRRSLALPLAVCAVVACTSALTVHLWGRGTPAANA
jgi:uncharacterized membrane protein YoaK (UPF0700 family)